MKSVTAIATLLNKSIVIYKCSLPIQLNNIVYIYVGNIHRSSLCIYKCIYTIHNIKWTLYGTAPHTMFEILTFDLISIISLSSRGCIIFFDILFFYLLVSQMRDHFGPPLILYAGETIMCVCIEKKNLFYVFSTLNSEMTQL